MKTISRIALLTAVTTLLVTSVPIIASANETDDRIESSAQTTYVFKKYLKDDAIKVSSKHGVVTLSGTVTEGQHKTMAQDTVENLPGVKRVDNHLEVKGAPVAGTSDDLITARVKAALLYHRNVSSLTKVTTTDGIVVLAGEANNQAEKDLTSEHVKDVEGVKGVENNMVVAPSAGTEERKTLTEKVETAGDNLGGKIEIAVDALDDASITALVKTTLVFHRSTSAHRTRVKTKDGRVTLTGTARNAAEKDLVTKYVEDVEGVKSVNNNITIKKH